MLGAPLFARENYRGRVVPTAAGIVLPVVALAFEAVTALGSAAGAGSLGRASGARGVTLGAVLGFALLGLFDDLAGVASRERGFLGHLGALARGRLTTGGLKLLGGGAVAVVVCAPLDGARLGRLVPDAALVALAANLGNLFDRAPGRAVKVGSLAFAVLALTTSLPVELTGVAVVVGASLALAVPDLRERLMLGDTGANALGAALGLGVVIACSFPVRLVVLVVVLTLNLVSEAVSFSRIIDGFAPLRRLDRAGRQVR